MRRPIRTAARLAVELLEDRTVPSVTAAFTGTLALQDLSPKGMLQDFGTPTQSNDINISTSAMPVGQQATTLTSAFEPSITIDPTNPSRMFAVTIQAPA